MKVYGIFSKKLGQRVDLEGRITTKRDARRALQKLQSVSGRYFQDDPNDLEIRQYEIRYR